MASYAQVAAQYVFLLVGANSIGNDATSAFTTIVGLVWMLYTERTQREYFSGESMRSGLSLTDNDDIVRIDMDGELPAEHVPPGTHL
jgi:hypothetical protein